MWFVELLARTDAVRRCAGPSRILGDVHSTVTLDFTDGPISIGPGTRICENAVIRGPVTIGRNCTIGTNTVIRGATEIGDGVLIGNGAEVKNALIEQEASLGPCSYVADSIVRGAAFLGALVRTSNYRLDRKTIAVRDEHGETHDTGLDKLGCEIGAGASLGVGCVVFPGRVVAAHAQFGPGIHIVRNLAAARYDLSQHLASTPT